MSCTLFNIPNLLELEAQIIERDRQDSTRKIAPLIKDKDAKEYDGEDTEWEEYYDKGENDEDYFKERFGEDLDDGVLTPTYE